MFFLPKDRKTERQKDRKTELPKLHFNYEFYFQELSAKKFSRWTKAEMKTKDKNQFDPINLEVAKLACIEKISILC